LDFGGTHVEDPPMHLPPNLFSRVIQVITISRHIFSRHVINLPLYLQSPAKSLFTVLLLAIAHQTSIPTMAMVMVSLNRHRQRRRHTIALTVAIIIAAYTDAGSPLKQSGWLKLRAERPIGLSENTLHMMLRGGSHDASGDEYEAIDESKRLVIVIDVDNTLYSERDLLLSTGKGIESQIVRNTHLFGMLHFNLTSDQCDELYTKYGSTIEGLRHTIPPDQVEDTMAAFYKEVYDPIDFSCLLGMKTDEIDDQVRSGYDHNNSLQHRRSLADFLKSLSRKHPVYLASNSPKAHVIRVINSMGLGGVDISGILSPDAECNTLQQDKSDSNELIYPTKSSPHQYYKQLLTRYPKSSNRIILLDDSVHNLNEAKSVDIDGIHVNQPDRSLEEGLSEAIGHILPPGTIDDSMSPDKKFTFSDIKYLQAKNKVDMNAINPVVWDQLAEKLALRILGNNINELRIADLGAGMLSMLEFILLGGGKEERKKLSLLGLIDKYLELGRNNSNPTHRIARLEYFAYESNLNLLHECKGLLARLGFQEVGIKLQERSLTFNLPASQSKYGMEITVHLRPVDFREERTVPSNLDVIIGCCLADLFDPTQFALSLNRFALGGRSLPLVYLPITFDGTTRFDQAYPSAPSLARNQVIPSDTTAFHIYSESLTSHGHNLDSNRIVNAMRDYGGSLISKESSDWYIDPNLDRRLWDTMIYFFGISGAREMMMKYSYDASGWINRCRVHPRTIVVSNVDLLFHLQAQPRAHGVVGEPSLPRTVNGEPRQTVEVQEIQFVAPYNVTTVTKIWDHSDLSILPPDQVEIESMYSLISSGTELKVFNGSFDSASLDVNIKGMMDKSMEYPLAYGYSLVGRVVACGSNVEDAQSLIGKLVFTFSPHSSRVIVDRDAIHIVPDGITAEDAVFFPSVETAVSLVHDANVRLGENVGVYGQGETPCDNCKFHLISIS
jgi:FMN phosphatase YigB (HAD superfamily)